MRKCVHERGVKSVRICEREGVENEGMDVHESETIGLRKRGAESERMSAREREREREREQARK